MFRLVFQNGLFAVDFVPIQGPDFDGARCGEGEDDIVVSVPRPEHVKRADPVGVDAGGERVNYD